MSQIQDCKFQLGILLSPTDPQLANCEQQFLAGLQDDGMKAALQFVDNLMARAKTYIDCKLGAGTPEAQAAWSDVASIVGQCVLAHLGKLLAKDYGGFIGGVVQCVGSKLLGGGGSGSPNVVYDPATKHRCGG